MKKLNLKQFYPELFQQVESVDKIYIITKLPDDIEYYVFGFSVIPNAHVVYGLDSDNCQRMDFSSISNAKRFITNTIKEYKLRICNVVSVYDAVYQILNSVGFNKNYDCTYNYSTVYSNYSELSIICEFYTEKINESEAVEMFKTIKNLINQSTQMFTKIMYLEPTPLTFFRKRKLEILGLVS